MDNIKTIMIIAKLLCESRIALAPEGMSEYDICNSCPAYFNCNGDAWKRAIREFENAELVLKNKDLEGK